MGQISATWQRLATSEELQRSSHVVSVVGGDAYIFGGELLPRQPRDNDVFRLSLSDTASEAPQTVSTTSTRPSPRVGTASAMLDGKIYLFSGRGGEAMAPVEESGAVWAFDASSRSWSLLTPSQPSQPLPAARSYHCSAANDGKIYIHAGCPESGRLGDLWCFTPATGAWLQLADAPNPPRGGTSIAFQQGRLYRAGGFDGKTEQGGSLDIYDPASNTWSSRAYAADGVKGPSPRSVASLVPVTIHEKPFLVSFFGERDPSSLGHQGAGKMLRDTWVYDIDGDEWTEVATKPDAAFGEPPSRGWFDADAASQSEVVVVGGLSETNERLGDVWVLRF